MKFKFDKTTEKLIITDASKTEYFQLKNHLTRHVKNYKFNPRYKLGVWDGQISHFKDGQVSMGLWKECFQLCQMNGWSFEIENKQDFPLDRDITYDKLYAFCQDFFKDRKLKDGSTFFPYDHQINSAYKILKNRYCITEVATGGGKSLIFSIVAFYILKNNPDAKFLLIVPNISLCSQFYDDITDYNLGYLNENTEPLELHLEEVMSDRPRRSEEAANIFIGTFQSLEKRPKEWFTQFKGVAMDECLHPDSMINMTDGTKKRIKDVQIGDMVITINEKTGILENKPVDYVYKNMSKGQQMYELEMEDGNTIRITGNHKVRIKGNTEWKRVDELTENDEIIDFNSDI